MNAADARRAIAEVSKRLVGLKPFLWGGTLLGAVREDRILPWDGDVDLGILAELAPADLAAKLPNVYRNSPVQPYMLEHAPMRQGNIGLRVGGVKVGLHLMALGGDGWRYYTFHRRLIRVPDPAPLARRRFLGMNVLIPGDAEGALAWLYGNWRVPVRHYNGRPVERLNQDRYLV